MPLTLAKRMESIAPSATVAATARAAAWRAAGHRVIALTAGEPDFPTPMHIQAAATTAMAAGETRYTAVGGTPALKAAIRRKFARENGLVFDDAEVMAATGAKQVIYNAILALIGPGDEVVIPTPAWVSYGDMVRLAGGTPVFVEGRAERGFAPEPDRLIAAMGPRTRALLLNSPCNPTGAVMGAESLRALGDGLARFPDVVTIADDIYEHLIYGDAAFATLAAVAPALADRVLTVNGVSKAHAMTGWRLGYAGGPAPLIAAMTVLQSQSTTNPCSIAQAGAVAALDGGLQETERMRQAFAARRDRMVARLSAIPGLHVAAPEGAFYLFVGVAGLLGKRTPAGAVLDDEAAVVDHLLTEAGVAVVGGAGFGVSPYIRLSFAAADTHLDAAALAMEETLTALA